MIGKIAVDIGVDEDIVSLRTFTNKKIKMNFCLI